MLTADLVSVRRRGDTLQLRPLSEDQRNRLLAATREFLAVLADHQGKSHGELQRRWAEVEVEPMDFKLLKGLRKLLEDRCAFELPSGLDPPALRRAVFTAAARQRRELSDGGALDVDDVLAGAAPGFASQPGPREAWLFADLTEHQVLTRFDRIDAARLVASYEWAQRQAVLLRAVSAIALHVKPFERG